MNSFEYGESFRMDRDSEHEHDQSKQAYAKELKLCRKAKNTRGGTDLPKWSSSARNLHLRNPLKPATDTAHPPLSHKLPFPSPYSVKKTILYSADPSLGVTFSILGDILGMLQVRR